MKIPFVQYFKQLNSVNIFVLSLRLIQFFFTGIVIGIISYGIDQNSTLANQVILSSAVFSLIVGVISLITHFVYCMDFTGKKDYRIWISLWDLFLSLNWLITFFWLWGEVKTNSLEDGRPSASFFVYYSCSWSAFNPFGVEPCGKIRAVLIMQIMIGTIWFITSNSGFLSIFKSKKPVILAK